VAVLPFKPLLVAGRDESLELGMADTLIARLSSLERLVVRPLSAVRRYSRVDQDPIAAGREQRVDVVIDGSLQRTENRIRVTVRVLKVSNSTALLAESFEEPLDDVFAVQDAICRRVADVLSLELTRRDLEHLSKPETNSLTAYRLYLLGKLSASRHTAEDDRKSIDLFQQALREDPAYAPAWAALADVYESLGTVETNAGHFEAARGAATGALELQPDLVAALTCLGKIAWEHDWDWQTAEHLLSRAVKAGPGNADAHIALSDYCAHQRRYEEAIGAAGRALEIDPTSVWVHALLAQALQMADLQSDAVVQARRTLEIEPNFAFAHLFLGLSEVLLHRWSDGIAHLSRARELSMRSDFGGALAWGLGRAGRRADARAIIRELDASGEHATIPLALAYAGLGDHERSLALFEEAAERRDWHVLLLHAHPMLRDVRGSPGGARFLARLGLCATEGLELASPPHRRSCPGVPQ
jgi:serine/threonine-protein kinase